VERETGVLEIATMNHAHRGTTEVRIAVAQLELILSTPTLASIAVKPAKKAETSDQKSQLLVTAPIKERGLELLRSGTRGLRRHLFQEGAEL